MQYRRTRGNFLRSLALTGLASLAALSAYVPAGEAEKPLAEVVPLEAKAEEPRKSEFVKPTLETVIDKNQSTVERQGIGEESVIVFPIMHPASHSIKANETEKAINTIQKCRQSAFAIYDAGIAGKIIIEGLDEPHAERHNRGEKLQLSNAHRQETQFFNDYTDLINGRNWQIIGIPNASAPVVSLERTNRAYEEKLQKTVKNWDKKGWVASKEKFDSHGQEAMNELTDLLNSYILEVVNYYEREDPQGKNLVKKRYYDQNSTVLNLAKPTIKEKKRVIIVCGALHEYGLRKEMDASQISYAVVRANDIPQYPSSEEEIAQRVREETLTFTSPINIELKDIEQSIDVDPKLKRRNFYKAYISPGQK